MRIWDPGSAAETAIQDSLDPVLAVALDHGRVAFASGISVCATG